MQSFSLEMPSQCNQSILMISFATCFLRMPQPYRQRIYGLSPASLFVCLPTPMNGIYLFTYRPTPCRQTKNRRRFILWKALLHQLRFHYNQDHPKSSLLPSYSFPWFLWMHLVISDDNYAHNMISLLAKTTHHLWMCLLCRQCLAQGELCHPQYQEILLANRVHSGKQHCWCWQSWQIQKNSIAIFYVCPRENQWILHRTADFRKSALSVCNVDSLIQLILCKKLGKLAM